MMVEEVLSYPSKNNVNLYYMPLPATRLSTFNSQVLNWHPYCDELYILILYNEKSTDCN